MENLYKEMQERLIYLESQKQTEEIKWRIAEITLAIVRVQQFLLSGVIGISDKVIPPPPSPPPSRYLKEGDEPPKPNNYR